jgi:hypothetical protein
VVAPGRAGLADLPEHLILVRRSGVGQVRQREQHAGAPLLDHAKLLLEVLLAL